MTCKCGSELFYLCIRANGWWEQTIDGDGEVLDTSLEKIRFGSSPKTVTCAECGRRNPNPSGNHER